MDNQNEDSFPIVKINETHIAFQKEIVEVITSLILKCENDLLALVLEHALSFAENILGKTCQKNVDLIVTYHTDIFNKYYFDVQEKKDVSHVKLVNDLSAYMNYGPHILLKKMFEFILDLHLDVVREKLDLNDVDGYEMSVLKQINELIVTRNIIEFFSATKSDSIPFAICTDGQKPFSVVFEKKLTL